MKEDLEKKFVFSAFLGNIFEHYDNSLYGVLSPFLAPLFFPSWDPVYALILTYAIIPLGMLSRPLGALYFGYIGDRYKRKTALFQTLFGMGCISMMVVFIPTYEQAGYAAPILMAMIRLLQNFFSAGETMGGGVYILERISERKQDLFSSLYNGSSIGGILLASAGASLMAFFGVIETHWRLLYVIGGVTAFFGCYLRFADETSFTSLRVEGNLKEGALALWAERHTLLKIAIVAGFSYACYSVALVMTNGFIPLITQLDKTQVINMNTCLLIFDFATLPLFGYLSLKFSRERVMLAAAICVIITAFPLFSLLEGASLALVVVIRSLFVIFGVWFSASFNSWCQAITPKECRYTLVSLGYALGSQIFGGPTAAISLWCYQVTGVVPFAAVYWVFLAAISAYVLIYTKETVMVQDRLSK